MHDDLCITFQIENLGCYTFRMYDLGVTLAEWFPLGGWITGVTNSGLMGWSRRNVKGVIRVGIGEKKIKELIRV